MINFALINLIIFQSHAIGLAGAPARLAFLKRLWRDRLSGVQQNVEVWQSLFSVRMLVRFRGLSLSLSLSPSPFSLATCLPMAATLSFSLSLLSFSCELIMA